MPNMHNIKNDGTIDIDDLPSLSELKKQSETVQNAPPAVVRRLPRYYRYLRNLLNRDVLRVSSSELSRQMGVTASQIRQDLNYFGDFGQQGYGYNVKYLYMQISKILGVGEKYNAVVLSSPGFYGFLADNMVFEMRGIRVRGIFDLDRENVGRAVGRFEVKHISELEEFCRNNSIDIAVIAFSGEDAENVSETVKGLKIRGIWNFSNTELGSNDDTQVQNLFPGDSLMLLMYGIKESHLDSDRIEGTR